MQFQGAVTVGSTALFVTGASANLARKPIIPDIVWGGGWRVNFATGHFEPTFSVNFPWFQSYGSQFIKNCIEENTSATGARNTFQSASLFNGGINASFTNVKCGEFSISANAMGNGAVECSASYSGKDEPTLTISGTPNTPPANTNGQTPIPSYATTAVPVIGSTSISSSLVTEWGLQVNNNPFRLFTCNGSEVPSDIQLGLLDVSGSYTYYSAGLGSAPLALTGSMVVTFGGITLTIPSLIYTDDGNDITGPNNKPMRVMRFTGMGTSAAPAIQVT